MVLSGQTEERDCVSLPNINVLEETRHFNEPVLSVIDPRRRNAPDSKGPKAVQVRSVTYTIGKKDRIVNILNRTNMTVKLGVIYSLLGPSGCGKTTLLRCVIGCLRPHRGLIRVFGCKPGGRDSHIPGPDVGYMPQEFALYDDLTIEETLIYFGRIYFMKSDLLQQRMDHLIETMELPDRYHMIKNCSGGQKRRVSFACALIHKPKLLLLDEPTVGVDPILRTRIWDILIHFTEQERMTVIITTHYIEETRRSHMIGFMRRGHILAEDSPSTLIHRYHVNNLEDVFYKLCVAQKRQSKLWKRTLSKKRGLFRFTEMAADIDDNLVDQQESEQPFKSFQRPGNHWGAKLNAVTRKILIQSIRQPSAIFAQFILPLVSLLLFCVCIGSTPRDVRIAVVNLENPPYLSERFISLVDQSVLKIRNETSLDQALEAVRRQELIGVLFFEKDFSDNLIRRSEMDQVIDERIVESSTIRLFADLTNKVVLVTVMRSLDTTILKFLNDVSEELGLAQAFFNPPIRVEEVIFGEYGGSDYFAVREYGVPGILIILTYSCAFGLTLMVLTVERARQVFERNFVAGVTTTQIILGHLIARILFMSFNVIFLFLVALFLFNVPCRGSPYEAVGLLLAQCIAGLTHGMMVSSMCPEFYMQAVVGNGVLITMFILSGALWPVESLPNWLMEISRFSPTTVPTESLRSILSKGLNYNHPVVYYGFIISVAWSVVFFFAAVILFSKTQKAKLK